MKMTSQETVRENTFSVNKGVPGTARRFRRRRQGHGRRARDAGRARGTRHLARHLVPHFRGTRDRQ